MERDNGPNELLELVYDELKVVAERYFQRQAPGFTMSPTEMVHETYLHLIRSGHADWTSTGHFRAIAIRKMWQVVIDHLKHRHAQKRNGRAWAQDSPEPGQGRDGAASVGNRLQRMPLESVLVEWHDRDVELLDLADALAHLGQESHRLREVVTLHWFGGMTHAEVAQDLGVSASTAEKDFRYAIAWLNRRLKGSGTSED